MPKLKITVKQWERLLKRLMERENVPPSIDEAKFLLNKYQPPPSEKFGKYLEGVEPEATGEYGRLLDYNQRIGAGVKGESVYKGEILPIQEARSKALSDPDRYEPLQPIPPVNRLNFEAPPGAPGELAEGISYERMKFKGLGDVKDVKKRAETLGPELGKEAGAKAPELSPLVQTIAEADDAWRALGGKRASVYNIFDEYWKASRIKDMYSDPKSYFVAQYIRWKTQPNFAKKFPRESAFFDNQVEAGYILPKAGAAGVGMGIGAALGQNDSGAAPPEIPPFGGPEMGGGMWAR